MVLVGHSIWAGCSVEPGPGPARPGRFHSLIARWSKAVSGLFGSVVGAGKFSLPPADRTTLQFYNAYPWLAPVGLNWYARPSMLLMRQLQTGPDRFRPAPAGHACSNFKLVTPRRPAAYLPRLDPALVGTGDQDRVECRPAGRGSPAVSTPTGQTGRYPQSVTFPFTTAGVVCGSSGGVCRSSPKSEQKIEHFWSESDKAKT